VLRDADQHEGQRDPSPRTSPHIASQLDDTTQIGARVRIACLDLRLAQFQQQR
jgi:hypothetical protein